MANFKQHIQASAISSGAISTSFLGANFINPMEALILWVAGSVSGILPDIDSDNSTALNIIFGAISLLSVSSILSQVSAGLSTLEIWLVILLSYAVINWVIRPIFESYTVHRGIFHSLLSGAFLSMLAVVVTHYFTQLSATMSWMMGLFVFIGYCTHLVLDEIYSVDLMNVQVKRSFGSACKLYEYKNKSASLLMLLAVIGLFSLSPNSNGFQQSIFSKQSYFQIVDNFLPAILKG